MKTQKYYIYSLLSCIGIFLAHAALANESNPSEHLYELLNRADALSSTFEQRIYDGRGEVMQTSTGEMMILRPDKFRWEVKAPDEQLLISNGEKLWIYDIDLEQVIIEDAQQTLGETPATLLSGQTNTIADHFTVSCITGRNGEEWFRLVPLEEGMFQWIEIGFREEHLHRMRMLDSLGQRSEFYFTGVIVNPRLNTDVFEFTPPEGVDVIE